MHSLTLDNDNRDAVADSIAGDRWVVACLCAAWCGTCGGYRAAFDGWDAEKIARYDEAKVAELLTNPGIVRNKLKVAAAISNAKAYLALRAEGQTLDSYLWAYVEGKPIVGDWSDGTRPTKTALSDRISKDLSKRGFKFVGSTIIYAYMQGIGMVDDHAPHCLRYAGAK